MKNLTLRKTACLIGLSAGLTLTACNRQDNKYENKRVETTETTKEYFTTNDNTTVPTTTESQTTTELSTTTEMQTTIEITTEQTTTSQIKQEETTTERVYTDEEVIEYINKVGYEIDETTEGITDSLKKGFITVVDFLFYDGTIGGRTFDSLSDDAKSTVLGIYDKISSYVEANWPIWKEAIGEKYADIKELWNDKKDDLAGLWESGKQKVKTWYENFKNNN